MPINESDPLGIGGGIDVSDPLGIAGLIQKMKPTGPSIGPWSPTIGQRLEMASPSLFGGEIQPATGMPEGLVPRAGNAVNSALDYSPFAVRAEVDPTRPFDTLPPRPEGFNAFVNPFLQQVNLRNVLLAGMLPGIFAAKEAGPVLNATKAGISALFGAQGAEQAGQAFGRASVQGLPNLGLQPGGDAMTIVGPTLNKLGLNTDGLIPTGQGSTEQWENLANEILGLAQVTGAAVGPHMFGRETSQGSYTPMQGPPIIEVPPERQLQAPRFQRGKAPYQSPFSPEMAQGSLAFPFERPDAPVDPPKNFTLPIIGERPLTIEQPIIRPGEVNPQDPLGIQKGIGFAGEPKQGGQISFQGQGIPSAMQSRVIPKGEQSEQAALMQGGFVPRVEKTKLQSGINPGDLLPAVNFAGKLLIGRQGDTHADILERNGIDPRAVAHPDPARGFVNSKTGEFLSRLEAQKQSGIVGTAEAGGLDSMDLPGAAKTKVMRDSGFSDSEVRENLKLQSGLNYDKILPGGKDDPMFPILTRIQDAGYETLYSEHGMGEGDSTPYVVFKRTTTDKDARIKEAAKVVGAEVEERPKRIGVYLKESDKVEDIKKDWESFTKYLGGGAKLHSGLEPIEDVFTPTARLLLRDPKRLRYEPSKGGEFDGGQLVNRLMNQVPPIEKDLLEKAGIREKFKAGTKVKAEEVDQWVKENSPKTEVKEYGMEGKVSAAKVEEARLAHELDTIQPDWSIEWLEGNTKEWSQQVHDKVNRVNELRKQIDQEIEKPTGPHATTAYKSVSPFDTTKYPVKRVDVVLPMKGEGKLDNWRERDSSILWPPDSIHEQLSNTLGWVMMQYKDGVAFIGEVQSRWGQWLREVKGKREYIGEGKIRRVDENLDHPLLRDYNRLILKAAIDQARKDGLKKVVVSDSKTALMTEMLDSQMEGPFDTKREAETEHAIDSLGSGPPDRKAFEHGGKWFLSNHQGGFDFNYDTAMPQIMEELTGKKGEKVEMGEHKNAREQKTQYDNAGGLVNTQGVIRQNLIFRNADSTPKTSVTGLSYDISEVGQPPYSMFGKKLYSGLPIFDESLWGSKEEAERMKGLFEKRQGKQEQGESVPPTITSMPPVKDPDKAQSIARKIGNTIIAKLSGFGVDRPMNEAIEAFTAKQAGWSAPRHVAANEELGNKLIRVAAADIASATEAKASSPENAAKIKAEAYKSLYKAYIDTGLGKEVTKGEQTPTIGNQPMEKVFINKKPLWIRKDLAPEFNQALQSDSKVMKAGASLLMDLATEAQIIGPTDFVFHMANMYASIAYDLGAKTTEGDLVRGTVPGARHVDAFTRIGYNVYRALVDSPEVQRELADIAKIGALRETRTGESLISRIPKVGKYIDTGEWIKVFDKAGRLARNKMFDNMVERKLLKDTELDRREFINKMGQYNSRLMSKFQDFQRQYFSQFVVAGRTFNRNAFQRVFMMNQARALNPSAYWKMKALNAASLYSALLVTPVVINSLVTGKPFGRPGTDIGSIDTGKNDKDGRPIQIDLLQTTLLRRGLRITGLQALQRDVRAEKDMPTTAVDMAKDVANGLIQPWSGPPVRVGYTMMTGKGVGFGGFKYSKDTDSVADNFMAGLAQVNPMIASSVEAERKGTSKTGEFVERTASAVGYKKGPFPTHEQDLEQETGKKVSEMPLSERVQAEKTHKEKAEKLSPEIKDKAAQRSRENITKRGEELSKEMSKADRQWMESRGLYLPGFDNKIHAGKTLLYLTKDEMERLSKYTLESYNEAMTEVRQKYPQLNENSRDIYFHQRMLAANGKARARIMKELNSLNESNQKTKKRFTVFDNE